VTETVSVDNSQQPDHTLGLPSSIPLTKQCLTVNYVEGLIALSKLAFRRKLAARHDNFEGIDPGLLRMRVTQHKLTAKFGYSQDQTMVGGVLAADVRIFFFDPPRLCCLTYFLFSSQFEQQQRKTPRHAASPTGARDRWERDPSDLRSDIEKARDDQDIAARREAHKNRVRKETYEDRRRRAERAIEARADRGHGDDSLSDLEDLPDV
jgi:hypothetical protein